MRVGFDDPFNGDHGAGGFIEIRVAAGGNRGGKGRAQGTGLALASQVNWLLEDIGVNLQPKWRSCSASADEDPLYLEAVRSCVLENMSRAASRRFVEGAEDVTWPV